MTVRNKGATWRSAYAFGWSKARVLHELQNGRPFRTFPPGYEDMINWGEAYTHDHFDLYASALVKFVPGDRTPPIKADRQITIGIEIWDGAPPWPLPASENTPAATPAAPRAVSDSELRAALLEWYPPGSRSPGEEKLHERLEEHFKAPIGRDGFRELLKEPALQHIKLGRGKPRKARDK